MKPYCHIFLHNSFNVASPRVAFISFVLVTLPSYDFKNLRASGESITNPRF